MMRTSVLLTIIGGVCLVLVGLGFYLGTGTSSVTALIPAFIGGPLLLCGLVSINPRLFKASIHIAAVLAFLAAAGSARVFMKWSDLSVAARSAQLITFFVCLVLLIAYVASFIKARRSVNV